jgi:hypothetical protein
MDRSTVQDWLDGPGDLKEAEVDDVPVPGKSLLVRGLPAAYSNQAQSEALELKTTAQGEQLATINTSRLEILQFAHGAVEPKFSEDQAQLVAEKYGPAFKKAIAKIDELSGVDKEAIEKAADTFPAGQRRANGTSAAVESSASSGSS